MLVNAEIMEAKDSRLSANENRTAGLFDRSASSRAEFVGLDCQLLRQFATSQDFQSVKAPADKAVLTFVAFTARFAVTRTFTAAEALNPVFRTWARL
jgi:hypothetical protein